MGCQILAQIFIYIIYYGKENVQGGADLKAENLGGKKLNTAFFAETLYLNLNEQLMNIKISSWILIWNAFVPKEMIWEVRLVTWSGGAK